MGFPLNFPPELPLQPAAPLGGVRLCAHSCQSQPLFPAVDPLAGEAEVGGTALVAGDVGGQVGLDGLEGVICLVAYSAAASYPTPGTWAHVVLGQPEGVVSDDETSTYAARLDEFRVVDAGLVARGSVLAAGAGVAGAFVHGETWLRA